jgi:hypothetical protein
MRLVIVPIALLLLSGCSSPSEPDPAPTPTTNAAQATCDEFSALTDRTADLVVGLWTKSSEPGDDDELDGIGGEFDSLALKSEGIIGERIGDVAAIMLADAPIVVSLSPDDYFDALSAVQRACDAQGVTIGVATWN